MTSFFEQEKRENRESWQIFHTLTTFDHFDYNQPLRDARIFLLHEQKES